jgi:hypothetical protein
MLKFLSEYYSSVTGLLPALAAFLLYRKSAANYRPFFVFLWVAFSGDILNALSIELLHTSTVFSNIYVFIEFLVILWVFYKCNQSLKKTRYLLLGIGGLVIWILDNFVWHTISSGINSLYRIYYCIVIVFLSIDLINKLIIFERKKLIRNAMFLVCVTFTFYFSYKAYVESFYVLKFSFSGGFLNTVFAIMKIINLLSNLMYTIAVLCIPKKQEFYMRR